MNRYFDMVEKHKDMVLEAERYIWKHPEPGYREWNTHAYVAEKFRAMGYELCEAGDIPGFYTVIDTGRPGPTVLVMAELDSLINRTHPECDPETGAVHSCGHHAQCAGVLGLAAALREPGALEGLSGRIKIAYLPAEEGIEIGFRRGLIKEGTIRYTSGKAEFIARRYFDDVDIAFMFHMAAATREGERFVVKRGHNGVLRKQTTIRGKSAHAGGRPHLGRNALNAASLAILATNSLRETFREQDYIRVHSIITKGGDAVNAVPDEVMLESYVRAANPTAHRAANMAVNRAISAAAAANGCTAHITDMAGSEALYEDPNLRAIAISVFEEIAGPGSWTYDEEWDAASTDMGDISVLFPSIHAYATGSEGADHGKDYRIIDPYNTCVNAAKAELGILRRLLEHDAAAARGVMAGYTPTFPSVDAYLAHKDSIDMDKDTVILNADGTITLDFA